MTDHLRLTSAHIEAVHWHHKSNKQRRGTLPMIHNKEGKPCTLPNEVLDTWIDFFGDMEGGVRIAEKELREQWIQDYAKFQSSETPTLHG